MAGDAARDKHGTTVLVLTVKSLSKAGEVYGGPQGFATRLDDEAARLRVIAAVTMGVMLDDVSVKSYTQWNDGRRACRVVVLPGETDVLV